MLLAAFLRLWHVEAGWFGVDQARDLAWAEAIASGAAFPTSGPAMRNRFHLGATYYWFWSLPALVASGPRAFHAFAGLLGTASVLLTWVLSRLVCGPRAALAAAALLATWPIAVLDGRVAWAPAAVPVWSALVLLLAAGFLRRPGSARAAALGFVAALGTQLHVAALPVGLVAAGAVLLRVRALSARGVALVVAAAVLPVLPMLVPLLDRAPATPVQRSVAQDGAGAPEVAAPRIEEPRAHRVKDLLLVVPRVVAGLTPAARPRFVDLWLLLESLAVVVTLASVGWLLVRPPRAERAAAARIVAASYLAGVATVVLLPAEAWHYYLDATLVPGAVALGAAWQALGPRRTAGAVLVGVVACRAALLVWWIGGTASRGEVAASLDLLRLGGPRPEVADRRARLPSVATKEAAARILRTELGIPLARTWRDVHGAGFSDLDSDNGYFLRRADAREEAGASAERGPSAVVFHRGDFPAAWVERHDPPRFAGPLEIRAYVPLVRRDDARLLGCGGGAPPEQAPPEPLDYGSGAPPRPVWPCAEPTVEVHVAAAPAGTVVRLFARVDGAGRVVDVRAEPPAAPLASPAPGAGTGVELAPGPATVTVRLALEGPARLDLYELHGGP